MSYSKVNVIMLAAIAAPNEMDVLGLCNVIMFHSVM